MMLLSLAACTARPEPISPTEIPENTPETTAEPAPETTPEPTEEPTPEPTEEPTPEPTAIAARELDPAECVEKVAVIERAKDDDDELGVKYVDEIDEGFAPEFFCLDGGKLYIVDFDRRPLVVDTESGERSRLEFDPNFYARYYMPFAALHGKLVSGSFVQDIETSEISSVTPPVQNVQDYQLGELMTTVFVVNGECHTIVLHDPGVVDWNCADEKLFEGREFVYDEELEAWRFERTLYHYFAAEPEEEDDPIARGGIEFNEGGFRLGLCRVMGYDAEGNIYTVEYGENAYSKEDGRNHTEMSFCKYSPKGELITRTTTRFDEGEYFYDNAYFFDASGAIYVLANYETGVTVYRVTL